MKSRWVDSLEERRSQVRPWRRRERSWLRRKVWWELFCIDPGTLCWVWFGVVLRVDRSRAATKPREGVDVYPRYKCVWSARTFVWEAINGPLGGRRIGGLTCGQALCVNPDHQILHGRKSL